MLLYYNSVKRDRKDKTEYDPVSSPDKGFKAYVRVAKGNLPISNDLKGKEDSKT